MMVTSWFMGPTPEGFELLKWGERHTMLVRKGVNSNSLIVSLLGADQQAEAASQHLGRGRLQRFTLPDVGNVLVRLYRHGGLFRWMTGTLFCTWPPRPFSELATTLEVGRRGIPTVDVIAAVVERVWGPFYRGWLVSRELAGARDLWLVLEDGVPQATRGVLVGAVAGAIRRMHESGIDHTDLNLKNILVRGKEGKCEIYLIDFDKARLNTGKVSSRQANRNLYRLLRSVRKLDPKRQYFSEENWAAFMKSYYQKA